MIRFKTLLGVALLCAPVVAAAQANISNGTVRMGVRADGALMPSNVAPLTGITYLPTGADGLTPGCLCESWGIADKTSGQSGYTGAVAASGNISTVSFASTATTATSVTNAFGKFRVTHSYSPSATSVNLFNVNVTIENISNAAAEVLYGRAIDWDVSPTAFSELVTLQRGTSPALVFSSDNGFFTADPLQADSGILFTNQNIVDSGPTDHGAHFRFNFGTLAPGATLRFTLGYGAAASTETAMSALASFGAEAYTLGEPSNTADGSPNTYIFAFKGIGGSVIVAPPFTTCAAEGFTGAKLTLCRSVCETAPSSTLANKIRLYTAIYRETPPCAR